MPFRDQTDEFDGPHFPLPDSWNREIVRTEDGVTVNLQSDGVSFGVFGIYPSECDPDYLVDQVVDSLRDQFPDLEADSEVCDADDAASVELVFFCLDVITYCWIRSWRQANSTLFVYVQSIEPESKEGREVFDSLCRSAALIDETA